MSITFNPELPHNVLTIDTSSYERSLFASGLRPSMLDPKSGKLRMHGTTLSLENMLRSFAIPPLTNDGTPDPHHQPIILPNCVMHNSGNDAFMCLFALQMLLEPGTTPPSIKKGWIGRPGHMQTPVMLTPPLMGMSPSMGSMGMMGMPMMNGVGMPLHPFPGFGGVSPGTPPSPYDLSGEFGQMQVGNSSSRPRSRSPGANLRVGGKSGADSNGARRVSNTGPGFGSGNKG